MRDSNIAGIIRRQARERADRTAYVTPTRTWTFAEVDAESSRVAQGLASLGVGPGDRVACLTKHMAECGVLLLAACKLGAVCMPVNWRLARARDRVHRRPRPGEVHDGGRGLRRDRRAREAARAAEDGRDRGAAGAAPASGNESFAGWRARFDAVDPGHEAQLDDTTLQLYSSGTTGPAQGRGDLQPRPARRAGRCTSR